MRAAGRLFMASAILAVLLLLASIRTAHADQVLFQVPAVKRTEGRVTLEFESKSQPLIRQELAFSEVIDSETRRSWTSIGFVTHEPSVYYARGDVVLTKNKTTGRYGKLEPTTTTGGDGSARAPLFVPELEWFLRLTYTEEELRAALPAEKGHHVGPTGLLIMLTNHASKLKFQRRELRRNIECQVMVGEYARSRAPSVVLENFMPELKFFDQDQRKMFFYAIRETAQGQWTPPGARNEPEAYKATLTLDYYHTERLDKKQRHQLEALERDLSLPAGVGLSAFLAPYKMDTPPAAESFMMTFEETGSRLYAQQLALLAYDHNFNYLRLERVGTSVQVWDLNEDLLYHVSVNSAAAAEGRLMNSVDIEVPLEECSVLSFEEAERPRKEGAQEPGDSAASASLLNKPYETRGTSLRMIEFLGARQLVYIGRSTVRDLPCAIFESPPLASPPKIFQLKVARADWQLPAGPAGESHHEHDFDFIVQYHLLGTDPSHVGVISSGGQQQQQQQKQAVLLNDRFWPARVTLLARQKSSGLVMRNRLASLEITDFHFGLYGWSRKPSELFMMPACFDDQDEQLRLALELDFRPLDADDQRQLAASKYKLEFELANHLFRSLGLSRLHMTEFDFALQRQGQVLASFVISDRLEDKRVSYFGEGQLPQADSYLNNRVELQGGQQYTPESCLLAASHVKDVSLVIHCPAASSTTSAERTSALASCTAVFGESQPVVKVGGAPGSRGAGAPACQAYLFEAAREPPKSAIKSVDSHKQVLGDFELEFTTGNAQLGRTVYDPARAGGRQLIGRVRDFEVVRQQQLITISNYRYALPAAAAAGGAPRASNVRSFGALAYESASDCARVCNLDAACRSYSYCRAVKSSRPPQSMWDAHQSLEKEATAARDGVAAEPTRCVLSSLDLRANQVDKQLVNAPLDAATKQLEVREQSKRGGSAGVYKLEMASGCDVFERDILSMFTPTEELVRVSARIAEKLPTSSSASECARSVLALESAASGGGNSFTGAVFAYCPQTQTCLSDETLFGNGGGGGGVALENGANSTSTKTNGENDDDEDNSSNEPKGLTCEMYRKRYQTYFELSPLVMRRIDAYGEAPTSRNVRHIDLNLATVEECAHACWQTFGHSCLSFDFCSPSLCTVNLVAESIGDATEFDPAQIHYETRAGCLGYRRDLRWDALRREHLVGSHVPLSVQLQSRGGNSGRGLFLNLALMCMCAALFAAGLVVGRLFNDQLEIVTSTRRSRDDGPSGGGGSSGFAGFLQQAGGSGTRPGSGNGRRGERLSTNSKFNIENEIYEDPDAIRLEDFGGTGNGNGGSSGERSDSGADELAAAEAAAVTAATAATAATATATEKKPTDDQRRAGYMDVPNLI